MVTDTLNRATLVLKRKKNGNPNVNWGLLSSDNSNSNGHSPTPPAPKKENISYDQLLHVSLGAINHEMRTPLALIFQTIEMLEDPRLGSLTEEQRDALAILRRQGQILGQMIDGLLYVASHSDKQKKFRPVPARLEPVFENVISLAEFKARSKEITIETDISANLPAIHIDVKQLEEALTQILDNAIKFNRAGGIIKIATQADDTWVILRITDTGIGIEAELLNKIWDAFEQGADSLRRAQEGLGVGLSLARHIIEAHHGTVEVDTHLGQGSTFTIKLPKTKQPATTK